MRTIRWALPFLLLLFLASSANGSTSIRQTFVISGRVTDGSGNAIVDATVSLSGTQSGTTTTDIAGKYSFANLQAGGNYVLSPSKAGEYAAFNGSVNNLSGDVTVNLRLVPQVKFSVRVSDASGKGVSSAAIRVNDGRVVSTQTNSAGIANVSVGVGAVGDTAVRLVAEKPGFIFNPPGLTLHSRDGNQVVKITATPTDLPVSFIQFSAPAYVVGEGDGSIAVTVTRTGDTSTAVSASYSTSDTATATQKSDYITAAGTLRFAAGETTKNLRVLIIDNAYTQGNHAFVLQLTNPTGGASLGDLRFADVTIVDNDANPPATTNPLDNPEFFVREHYYDFLNREPDASGGAFWTNQITSCGKDDQACIETKHINVSASFFLSIEFQETGYLVERIYKTSFGDATGTSGLGGVHQLSVPVIRFKEFLSDTQEISESVVVGQGNWQQQVENNKQAFTTKFVERERFATAFPASMTPAEFVDKLNANAGNPLLPSERDQLVNDLSTKAKTRAQVLRVVAEDPRLVQAEFNRAFVLMEYFAYLRRNPSESPDVDYGGYDFWLTKLTKFKGNFIDAEMVKAFITSLEYRQRFGARLDKTPPTITFTVTPAPNAAGWNNSNPTVTFTCADAETGVAFCSEPVTITTETGNQIVVGTAVDNSGNSATVSVTVKLDKTPPSVTVTSPADGSKIFFSPVAVGGTVEDLLSGVASATCSGTPATVSGTGFNCGVTLTPGANSVTLSAIDIAGNTSTSKLALAYARPPTITIAAPSNLSYVNISPTTVTGTVDDPTATVVVNSVPAAVVNGSFSVALPLQEGPNTITASATTAEGSVGTASIQATLDTTPPHVTITSPPDQFLTTEASISVAGNVNDIVVGTVNAEQAQVRVNGSAAEVANRTFLAMSVPLAIGPNVIQAVGRDRVGNAATTEITVIRQAPGQPQIRLISGNNQTGIIGSVLASPLVVSVVDAGNNPVPNKTVIFKVTQDNGMVSTGGPSAATVIATTDAQGQAQAQWKLGMRSGAGANSVEAYSVGFEGTAIFIATGTQGPAGKIVIDTGNDQIAAANQPLPKPLIAVVVDDGNNRLAGVPVTFTVKEGGGNFGGQPSFTVNSDSDGRVAATLTLGLQEGNANNLVEATFPNNTSFPASFTASGRAPGNPVNTSISGVVLDNSNVPIPGVMVRAVLTNMLNANSGVVQTLAGIQTNDQGQFFIPQAPVGFVKLLVDGSTAQRPGVYPTLDYDLVTVAGQDNKLSMPIFLLPLNTDNKLCVTATTGGGTLTIPEAPGFSLTFGPGQVTFPGGSKTGCVSVTVVHGDKVPMVPGFGQQPRFIVTIQPSGAVFNLPASITLPNVDGLKPREVTEMYSFDHDIGSFVAIGTGTVSDDGQVIRSNPGVGVLKAGWHCGGNPNVSGGAGTCPTCQKCDGQRCVADAGGACDDNNKCTTNDKCVAGTCTGTPVDTSRITDDLSLQVDSKLPPSILSKINSIIQAIPGLESVSFDEARVGFRGTARDCCDKDKGPVTLGEKEGAGTFTLTANLANIPLFGSPSLSREFDFGVAIVQIDFRVGAFFTTNLRLNAEGGLRTNACNSDQNCGFGELNASIDPEIKTTFEAIACLETLFSSKSCGGITITPLAIRANFSAGLRFNKPSCGSGLSGFARLGRIVLRAEFALDVPGGPRRFVLQFEVFGGSQAGL
jgi:Calx-beta domain-containing protein/glucodextranase-like protein/carboxypeptidase family protein